MTPSNFKDLSDIFIDLIRTALMLWGLIALFILLSLMGILAFLYRDFGFGRPFGPPLLPI
ncbi:MAG: hypothetical protein UV94_C0043G0004 [Parcubacteria group bacterium GW2011_GWC1_43_30]|nr:MAG: hypothetical protein UV94_C0043G0004 [Parcubacteria group bacterium GW2011_GWC1_43_30]